MNPDEVAPTTSRRTALRGLGVLSAGVLAGAGGAVAWDRSFPDRPTGGYSGFATRNGRPSGHAPVTWAVETSAKLVAFTFDDGPVPRYTPMVLDALDAARITATFFLVGQRLDDNAALVRGRLDRHEVGNHTWSHKDLSDMEFSDARREVEKAHQAITRIVGREPRLLRPPFGTISTLAMRAADDFGYDIILWSHGVTERTFQADPDSVIPYVTNNMRPGTIFLAHDAVADGTEPVFLRRIGEIATGLRQSGYEFVTVSELLAQREPGLGLATG